jgi:hypothetical protein
MCLPSDAKEAKALLLGPEVMRRKPVPSALMMATWAPPFMGSTCFFAADGEVEEGREAADSEYDLAAVGGPLRGEHELFAIEDGAGGLSFVDD